MTKKIPTTSRASWSRFSIFGTLAGVLAAGVIAWVIVDRFEAPSVLPSVTSSADGQHAAPKSLTKPLWDDLSSAQQVALAPLEPEWNRMEVPRKRKWIEMSSRFASLSAAEQQRVHERMRVWMKLTPAQRELARENYSRTNRVAQGDKSADWENYKQLSEAQRRQLARTQPAARNKSVPIALPEAPMLVTPMPCPPNTTRRGAGCVTIGTEELVVPTETANVPPAAAPANNSASTMAPTPTTPGADPTATAGNPGAGAIAAPGGQQPAQAANAGN